MGLKWEIKFQVFQSSLFSLSANSESVKAFVYFEEFDNFSFSASVLLVTTNTS